MWDLTFRLAAPESTQESGRFVLPLKPVAAGRLSFRLPGDTVPQLRVEGGANTYRILRDAERSVAEVGIDRGGEIRLEWQPATLAPAASADVARETGIAVLIGDAGLRTSSSFQLEVRQGSLTEQTFLLPGEGQLERISGPDVGGWELQEESQRFPVAHRLLPSHDR